MEIFRGELPPYRGRNFRHRDKLREALAVGNIGAAEILFFSGKIDFTDMSPVFINPTEASDADLIKIIELLSSKKVGFDEIGYGIDKNALMLVRESGREAVVKALLDNGALDIAKSHNQQEIVTVPKNTRAGTSSFFNKSTVGLGIGIVAGLFLVYYKFFHNK